MADDTLVGRLRERPFRLLNFNRDTLEAADRIESLLAEVDGLKGALEPFARSNPHKNEDGLSEALIGVTIADIRRAKAALAAPASTPSEDGETGR